MITQGLINELTHEAAQTRKMLEKVPLDQSTWKPHEKSMMMGRLAAHVAELPGWIDIIINQKELDLGNGYPQYVAKTQEELLQFFDDGVQKALNALQNTNRDHLMEPWTLRKGEQVFFTMPRIAVIRNMALNHFVHHRGQLSVYLRLQNIAIPGMYGPSADDKEMAF